MFTLLKNPIKNRYPRLYPPATLVELRGSKACSWAAPALERGPVWHGAGPSTRAGLSVAARPTLIRTGVLRGRGRRAPSRQRHSGGSILDSGSGSPSGPMAAPRHALPARGCPRDSSRRRLHWRRQCPELARRGRLGLWAGRAADFPRRSGRPDAGELMPSSPALAATRFRLGCASQCMCLHRSGCTAAFCSHRQPSNRWSLRAALMA